MSIVDSTGMGDHPGTESQSCAYQIAEKNYHEFSIIRTKINFYPILLLEIQMYCLDSLR